MRSISTTAQSTLTGHDLLVNADVIACFARDEQGIMAAVSPGAGGRMSVIEQSRSDMLSHDLTDFVRRYPVKGMVLPFRDGVCFIPLCGPVPESWLLSTHGDC